MLQSMPRWRLSRKRGLELSRLPQHETMTEGSTRRELAELILPIYKGREGIARGRCWRRHRADSE